MISRKITASSHKKGAGSITQFKGIYTNAHSMGNKTGGAGRAGELWHSHCHMVEALWHDSHIVERCSGWLEMPLKAYTREERWWDMPCMLGECFHCLQLDSGDERVVCLWAEIKENAKKAETNCGSWLQTTQARWRSRCHFIYYIYIIKIYNILYIYLYLYKIFIFI